VLFELRAGGLILRYAQNDKGRGGAFLGEKGLKGEEDGGGSVLFWVGACVDGV
jgi:hypothetical protein